MISLQTELSITPEIRLFDSLIGSSLNLSAEAWDIHPALDIEANSIHKKYCRKVLDV